MGKRSQHGDVLLLLLIMLHVDEEGEEEEQDHDYYHNTQKTVREQDMKHALRQQQQSPRSLLRPRTWAGRAKGSRQEGKRAIFRQLPTKHCLSSRERERERERERGTQKHSTGRFQALKTARSFRGPSHLQAQGHRRDPTAWHCEWCPKPPKVLDQFWVSGSQNMCVCVCMYIYIYIYIYIFIYLFIYLFVYLFIYLFIYLFMYSLICLFTQCASIPYTHTHICIYIYIYIYIQYGIIYLRKVRHLSIVTDIRGLWKRCNVHECSGPPSKWSCEPWRRLKTGSPYYWGYIKQ